MPITTSCPACFQKYTLADSQLGKTVSCRKCSRPFLVSDDEAPAAARPAPSAPAQPPAEPLWDRPARYDNEYDRPRRPRDDQDDRRYDDRRPDDRRYDDRRYDDDREDDYDRPRRPREHDDRPPRRQRSSGAGVPLMVWLLLAGGLTVLVLTGLVIAFLSLDFGSKVTTENYNKLKEGMTEKHLRSILGPPTRDVTQESFDKVVAVVGRQGMGKALADGRVKVLLWESGKKNIMVTLYDGRAMGFSKNFSK
jgi:hypothetical protein